VGYTNYWYRPLKLTDAEMKAIGDDFNKIVLALDNKGVKLGDGLGEGVPIITPNEITFNGLGEEESHETCSLPQDISGERFLQPCDENKDLYFTFCKTARKPYDLAVTALLIIAKHHLRERIRVSSDGEDSDWSEAKALCQLLLRYGSEFKLADELTEV
jgi:hypothetical protein